MDAGYWRARELAMSRLSEGPAAEYLRLEAPHETTEWLARAPSATLPEPRRWWGRRATRLGTAGPA